MLERVGPPSFPIVIEMRARSQWITHWVEESVDALLNGKLPTVEVRPAQEQLQGLLPSSARASSWGYDRRKRR